MLTKLINIEKCPFLSMEIRLRCLRGQYWEDVIERVLGQGGFGITYKAADHKTGKNVAVKEFFPDSMAARTTATAVSAFSGKRGESFLYGKGCFLKEAETLAQFIGNEHIVRVFSYFEENGTAYFVMEYKEGTSFDQYIKNRGGKLPYEEAEKGVLAGGVMFPAGMVIGQLYWQVINIALLITGTAVMQICREKQAAHKTGNRAYKRAKTALCTSLASVIVSVAYNWRMEMLVLYRNVASGLGFSASLMITQFAAIAVAVSLTAALAAAKIKPAHSGG